MPSRKKSAAKKTAIKKPRVKMLLITVANSAHELFDSWPLELGFPSLRNLDVPGNSADRAVLAIRYPKARKIHVSVTKGHCLLASPRFAG
jgi:hypothetical protein